jgi:hypothetical protein
LIPHQETPEVEAAIEIKTISASKTRARCTTRGGTLSYRAGKGHIDFETFLPNASADPKKPCTPDIERYLMAHSSGIHANYGDWLVPDLKAGIECSPDPLVNEADTEVSVSGVLSALAAAE